MKVEIKEKRVLVEPSQEDWMDAFMWNGQPVVGVEKADDFDKVVAVEEPEVVVIDPDGVWRIRLKGVWDGKLLEGAWLVQKAIGMKVLEM